MFYRRLFLAAALLSSACSTKKEVGPPPRYAVLRFENLTPDPSLNWIGRAVSEVLSREIGGIPSRTIYRANESFGRRPISAPGVSSEFSDALLAGGNRIITGYYEQVSGNLRFTAIEEDARTGKTLKTATAQGSVFDVCLALARQFTTNPKSYVTSNETALRDFMQGVEAPGAELYQKAVAADPKYSDAYLAWSEDALAHGDAETLSRILAEARANHVDDATLAKLEFAAATAGKDTEARNAALKRIVATDPGDVTAIQALGEVELAAHHFREAAAAFAKGASDARPDLINQQAYALMFAGDEKGAIAAAHEYQKASPGDANAIDTEGDIQFYFGHFSDAEKSYLGAIARDPQFNQSSEKWKVAWARLMTGDVAGATQIFNAYRQEREKAKDITIPFRAARWQFLTGDRNGAIAAMRSAADSTSNAPLKSLELVQASIWELQMGHKKEAIQDAETVMKSGQNALPAAMVRFAAQEPAPLADLNARAEHLFAGPALARFRPAAIGYALIFARQYKEAAPVWKQLFEESNPNDQSVAFIYAKALRGSGHEEEAAPLLKGNPLPSVNLAPTFESLYFPELFEWRGDKATYLKLSGNTAAPAK